jgi:hypothetical protein
MIRAEIQRRRQSRSQVEFAQHVAEDPRRGAEVRDLIRHRDWVAHRLPAGPHFEIDGELGHRVRGHDRQRGIEDHRVLEHATLESA